MGALQPSSHVVIDTPGQIEIFTWSASGAIITDAVASALPTVIAYIVDTPRAVAPATFMSNMLYACRYVIADFYFLAVSRVGLHCWHWESPEMCFLELQSSNSGYSVSCMTHYSSVSSTRPSFRS